MFGLYDQVYRPNHAFSSLPYHNNNNLKDCIIFQYFMLSFLLIQLKAKMTFSQWWWMSYTVFCTKMNTPHREKKMVICFWEIFLVFVFFQLEVQSCCVFLPNDSLPSPSTIVSGDIPGTVRSWYHGQAGMPGTLVVCLPQIKIMSAGHKHMEPLQEIPFVVLRPILEEGSVINSKKAYSLISIFNCYENYLHFILKTSDFVLLF